jgi:predicted acylesterase/phospholipase RssA
MYFNGIIIHSEIKRGFFKSSITHFVIAGLFNCCTLYAAEEEEVSPSSLSEALVKTSPDSPSEESSSSRPYYGLKSPAPDTVKVLSLQGGGVRGIIEAQFLNLLEQKTGRHTTELFHLIGGASAGGILAAALTTPENSVIPREEWRPRYSALQLVERFEEEAPNMFQQNEWSWGRLLGPKHKTSGLVSVLETIFGNHTFDQSLIPTLIPAYDLDTQRPKFFKSWKKKEIFHTRDIAIATSCGPTYFAPYSLSPLNETASHHRYTFIDGGMAVTTPASCLMVAAKKLFPAATKFEIVSLGCGEFRLPFSPSSLKVATALTWAQHAPDIFVTSQNTLTDYLMRKEWKEAYSSWNPVIPYKESTLDDPTPEHLAYLKNAATEMVKKRQEEFDTLAARLAS